MKIDITSMSYAIVRHSSNQEKQAERLQAQSDNGLPTSADAARLQEIGATSSVVSISESARIAALAADSSEQQQSILPKDALDTQSGLALPDLNRMLVALWSGRKILGVSAADLAAARGAAGNADLQLKLIEQAAVRAGLGIQRQIPTNEITVDQTTFQARGVIRTDEGIY